MVDDTEHGMCGPTRPQLYHAFLTINGGAETGLGLWVSEELLKSPPRHIEPSILGGGKDASGTAFRLPPYGAANQIRHEE